MAPTHLRRLPGYSAGSFGSIAADRRRVPHPASQSPPRGQRMERRQVASHFGLSYSNRTDLRRGRETWQTDDDVPILHWQQGVASEQCRERGFPRTVSRFARRATHRARSLKRRLAVPGPLELEEAVCLGDEHDAVP